ncbi:hypothetical protein UPYG_G00108620, partial [Umbra pygmaea]
VSWLLALRPEVAQRYTLRKRKFARQEFLFSNFYKMPPKGEKSLSKKRDIHVQEALEEIFRESDSEVLDCLDSGSEYSFNHQMKKCFWKGKIHF